MVDPWEFDTLAMPEAPRDPSVDSAMKEPEEDFWPRGRDTAMALLMNQRERLLVAIRYVLEASPEDQWRARSSAERVLKDIENEKEGMR